MEANRGTEVQSDLQSGLNIEDGYPRVMLVEVPFTDPTTGEVRRAVVCYPYNMDTREHMTNLVIDGLVSVRMDEVREHLEVDDDGG